MSIGGRIQQRLRRLEQGGRTGPVPRPSPHLVRFMREQIGVEGTDQEIAARLQGTLFEKGYKDFSQWFVAMLREAVSETGV